MNDTIIYDRRSIIEMSKIIDFCSGLVLKDDDLAQAAETTKSMNDGYKFLNAMLKADTLSSYIVTKSDLIQLQNENLVNNLFDGTYYNPSEIDVNHIPDEYAYWLLELKRYNFYLTYMKNGDSNSYYQEIYDTYISNTEDTITRFIDFINNANLPFFAAVRLYKNFSLLYTPTDILASNEVVNFKRCYNKALNYFEKTMYNDAYKIDNEKYNDLCKIIIIFLAIQLYLNSRLENIDDIDLFDEYSIRNLFLSYGLDYFFDFPLKYQKRVLKNINFLIKNKGNNKAIVNVLSIFGFDNIKIMKYILCKEYKKDDNGNIDPNDPVLRFYGIDTEINNIEEALKDKHTRSYDYDSFVSDDKYWQITDEEKQILLNESYNYVYSKYISIESFMDLTRFGLDFSYFSNLLYYIESKFRNLKEDGTNKLHFFNYKVSSDKIKVIDALFCMYALIMKKYDCKDIIVQSPSAIAKVYDFNFGDLVDDVLYFTQRYVEEDLTEYEYNNYVFLVNKYELNEYHLLDSEIERALKFKTKQREGKLSSDYINNFIKQYKVKDYFEAVFNEYLIGNVSISEVKECLDDADYETNLFNYLTYVFLLQDIKEDKYTRFLNQYSLAKNEVLVNYFIKSYLQNDISESQFDSYLEKYDLIIDSSIDIDEIKSYKNNYQEGAIKDSDYLKKIKEYEITSKEILTAVEGFINGSISDRAFRIKMAEAGLDTKEVLFKYLTYHYLNDEYSELQYLNNISIYNLNPNNIHDTEEIVVTKKKYKSGEISSTDYTSFRSNYYLDLETLATIQAYYDGDVSEFDFETYLYEHKLNRTSTLFKYFTYLFLEIDEYELNYDYYITKYSLDTTLTDEIKNYKSEYYISGLAKDEYEKYIKSFTLNPKLIYMKDKYLENNVIDKFKKDNLTYINFANSLTYDKFIKLFKNNSAFRTKLENQILKEKNYENFKKLKALHYCTFLGNFRHEIYGKYKTFTDYFNEYNPDLALFMEKCETAAQSAPADRELIYNEYILELSNSLETYLNSDEFNFIIQGSTILNDYIKDFVYQMIDFIKSYTIHIKEINTILVFDDKFMNSILILDAVETSDNDFVGKDLISIYDKIDPSNIFTLVPEFFTNIKDFYNYITELSFNEKFKDSDKLDKILTTIHYSDLVSIKEKNLDFSIITTLVDLYLDLNDRVDNTSTYTIKDVLNIVCDKYFYSDINKNSELINLNDKNCNITKSYDLELFNFFDKLFTNHNKYNIKDFIKRKDNSNIKSLIKLDNNYTIHDKLESTNKYLTTKTISSVSKIDYNTLYYNSILYEDQFTYKFNLNYLLNEDILIDDSILNLSNIDVLSYTTDTGTFNDFRLNNNILTIPKTNGILTYINLK